MKKTLIVILTVACILSNTGLLYAAEAVQASESADESTAIEAAKETPAQAAPIELNQAEAVAPAEGDQGTLELDEDDPQSSPFHPEFQSLGNMNIKGLSGSFNVDQFSGAAVYSYQLDLPPGRAGLAPQLSLNYNSHQSNYDSLAGFGWGLSQSYIVRSAKKSNELYTANEFTLVLNGQSMELKPVDLSDQTHGLYGAKAEEAFLLIEFLDDESWRVTGKSGQTFLFGTEPAARQDNPEDAGIIYRWLLGEVRDTNDNYLSFEYYKEDGQIYPKNIKYTGHEQTDGPAEVRFEPFYSTPDQQDERIVPHLSYMPHFAAYTKYLVSEITVLVDGLNERKFVLDYTVGENDLTYLLSSIQRFDYADNQWQGLPASTFTYQTRSHEWLDDTDNWNQPTISYLGEMDYTRTYGGGPVEANGDGWTDYAKVGSAYLNTKNDQAWNDYYGENSLPFNPLDLGFFSDINGDQLIDFIDERGGETHIRLNTPAAQRWSLNNEWSDNLPDPIYAPNFVTDINGDGLGDLLQNHSEGNNQWNALIYLNNGDSTWSGAGYWNHEIFNNESWQEGMFFIDVNNDGLADLIKQWGSVVHGDPGIYLNTGDGWSDELFSDGLPGGPWEYGCIRLSDINNDGLLDVVESYEYNDELHEHVYINNGSDWVMDDSWEMPTLFVNHHLNFNYQDLGVRLFDINADGSTDVVQRYVYEPNPMVIEQHVYLGDSRKPDLLSTIDNGYGGETTLTYKSSARIQDGEGNYRNQHLPFILQTVESVTVNDGLGNQTVTGYEYYDGHYYLDASDPLENQFAGFHEVIRKEVAQDAIDNGNLQNAAGVIDNENKDMEIIDGHKESSLGILEAGTEIVSLRDRYHKVFYDGVNPEGKKVYKLESRQKPVHYQDQNQNWQEIDVSLKASAHGWQMNTADYQVILPGELNDDSTINFTYKNNSLQFNVKDISYANDQAQTQILNTNQESQGNLVESGIWQDKKLVYPNALGANVDLEISLTNTSLKKETVIKNSNILNNIPAEAQTVDFKFKLDGLNQSVIYLTDITGQTQTIDGAMTGAEYQTATAIKIIKNGQSIYIRPAIIQDAVNKTEAVNVTLTEENGQWYLIKHLPVDWLKEASFPVRTDSIISLEASSGDGAVRVIDVPEEDWDYVHNSTAGNGIYGGLEASANWHSPWGFAIFRSFLSYDTSILPENAQIDTAAISLFPWIMDDDDNGAMYLVEASQASVNALEVDDYDNCGSVHNPETGGVLDFDDVILNEYNNFVLDATGLSWINKSGWTKFGLRERHDIEDVAPPSVGAFNFNYLHSYTTEHGAETDPYLTVQYTLPTPPNVPASGQKVIKSYYHQGGGINGQAYGEFEDHIAKKGKMYRQEIYQDQGENLLLLRQTINKWDVEDLGNDRTFVKLDSATNFDFTEDVLVENLDHFGGNHNRQQARLPQANSTGNDQAGGEVGQLKSKYSKTVYQGQQNGQSLYSLEVNQEPNNYLDENNAWQTIDPTLNQTAFGWQMFKADYQASLPEALNDESTINFSLKNNLIQLAPAVMTSTDQAEQALVLAYSGLSRGQLMASGPEANRQVAYAGVFGKDVDLELTLTNLSLKEEVVFQDLSVFNNLSPESKTVALKFRLNNVKDAVFDFTDVTGQTQSVSGSLTDVSYDTLDNIKITQNNQAIYIWPALMEDASRRAQAVVLSLTNENGQWYLIKNLPLDWLKQAEYPVRTDAVLSFELPPSDGYVEIRDGDTWNTAHDSAIGEHAYPVRNDMSAASDRYRPVVTNSYTISRMFLPFNTSQLPDIATVTGATLSFYPIYSDSDDNAYISLVETDQASTATLVTADYDNCGAVHGAVRGSADLAVNDITLGEYNELPLNQEGLAWISLDGWTRLGVREGHDLEDVEPAGGNSNFNYVTFKTTETGGEFAPYLTVWYTVPENVPPYQPMALETEGQTNPIAVYTHYPNFTGVYYDANEPDYAKWYQLQVIAEGGSFNDPLWDSGKTLLPELLPLGQRTPAITYGGDALAYDGATYYWRLRFWDDEGEEGAAGEWSAGADSFIIFDAGSTIDNAKITTTEYTYSLSNGNLLATTQLGEVYAYENGLYVDDEGDSKEITYEYAQSQAGYLEEALKKQTVTDPQMQESTEQQIYYDGLAYGQVQTGNLTKEDLMIGQMEYDYAFNDYGLVTQKEDPLGQVTAITYDDDNYYPAATTNHLNQTVLTEYDLATGQITRSEDPNGLIEERSYDAFGRLTEVRRTNPADPGNLLVMQSYEYHDAETPSWVKQSNRIDLNNWLDVYTYFDGLGRQVQTREESLSGDYLVVSLRYDMAGRLERKTIPYVEAGLVFMEPDFSPSTQPYSYYTYDGLDRVISETFHSSTSNFMTTYEYDGWNVLITDPEGHQKKLYKDAYNQLVRVDEYLDGQVYATHYAYNYLNKITKIIDAEGNERNFEYDSLGRLISQEEMHRAQLNDGFGVWAYEYDDASNLVGKSDPEGQVTAYEYDALNRLLFERNTARQDQYVSYIYDGGPNAIGRLSKVEINGNWRREYGYDIWGRVTSELSNSDFTAAAMAYNYTLTSQPSLIHYLAPEEYFVAYEFNTLGQPVGLAISADGQNYAGVIEDVSYSPLKQIAEISYTNGTVTENTFDPLQAYRLTQKVTLNGQDNLQDLTYAYDAAGNIISLTDSSATVLAKTTVYEYDDLYRLTSATVTDSANNEDYVQTYAYDIIGNIINKSDIGDYSYVNNNPYQATTINGNNYTYYNNGNLKQDPAQRYWYNYQDRLSKAQNLEQTLTSVFGYDQSGQRVYKKVTDETGQDNVITETVYPNQYLEYEYLDEAYDSPTSTTKHLFFGNQRLGQVKKENGQNVISLIFGDHLGSSSVMTDEQGNIIAIYDYYPYGSSRIEEEVGAQTNRRFTGHELDEETNLTYAGARYYAAGVGRFTQADELSAYVPYGYQIDPQKLNEYAYGRNNPIKYIDPDGRIAIFAALYYGAVWLVANIPAVITTISAAVGGAYMASETGAAAGSYMEGDTEAGDQHMDNAMTTGAGVALTAGETVLIDTATKKVQSKQTNTATGKADPGNSGEANAASKPKATDSSKATSQSQQSSDISKNIANGHAYEKHKNEFGVETQTDFAKKVKNVLDNPTEVKNLEKGRVAYWDDKTKSVVIYDPSSTDQGTALVPTDGRDYFNNLK